MNGQYLWWLVLLGLAAAVAIGWVAAGPVPDDLPGDDKASPAGTSAPAPEAPSRTAPSRDVTDLGRYEPRETRWPDTRWPDRMVSDDPPDEAGSTSETP